jgi:2-oxoglutarate dehydrogenase E1 component
VTKFHTLAASGSYIEGLLERFAADPDELPQDWRSALALLECYFPQVLSGTGDRNAEEEFIRRFAHLAARLDPLNRLPAERWNQLAGEFTRRALPGPRGAFTARLLEVYGGTLAVEAGHIEDPGRVEWIYAHREAATVRADDARRRALAAVVRAETFERFMGQRFVGKKRFGAEGAESLHALIQRVLDRAAAAGVSEVIIGTMHRGRLGLMTAVFGQALAQLFGRMKGEYPLREPGRAADVPYHLGLTADYHAPTGTVKLRLLPNPSHLEAINAVTIGYARSRQDSLGSAARVLPLILHTDASAVAQGVVSEALQVSNVAAHTVGGALHVIVNNQLGFTTDPDEARSARHCTAAWKAVDSLIAHVNGDDVDAVLMAADIAFDYRERFAGESVVDLVCLRANGHNEVDEPRFTQPTYYELADQHPAIGARYSEKLVADQVIEPGYAAQIVDRYRMELEEGFAAENTRPESEQVPACTQRRPAPLDEIANLASRVPPHASFNQKAARLVAQRAEEWRSTVSWATAELLALGAALSMGWNVRLSGQDVERGAFSQRHLSLVDATGARHRVFKAAPDGWGKFDVFNTALCEYAALAFEYGYSAAPAQTLTLWEAQFGDFANVAQAVFDQFISSGEEKWAMRSGLVVLLPHGLEGQGPEHSSARMERMLQLAAKDNLRIAHPTTPANYFHLLLSQLAEAPAKPLIVFTPKKLLRLKAATSPPEALRHGTFQKVIVQSDRRVTRVILCSGKIFYDLADTLEKVPREDLMLIRLEQLYPFPIQEVAQALRSAPGADVVWLQEEPSNFGIWTWLRAHLERAIASAEVKCGPLTFISRPESPSPAGSFHAHHEVDQARLIALALGGS